MRKIVIKHPIRLPMKIPTNEKKGRPKILPTKVAISCQKKDSKIN